MMINVPVLGQSLKIRKKAKWGKNWIFERKKKVIMECLMLLTVW